VKPRGSSWSEGKLHRLPPWHATLALRVCLQGTAADDDDDEEFPVLALCCLKILQFELGSSIDYRVLVCVSVHTW